MTLLADVNHPGSQKDMVSNWQPTPSLVEVAVSGAEIAPAPCLPTLAVTHLPLCPQRGRALSGSGLALFWYSLGHNPLFSECTRGHHEVLAPSHGRVLFSFVFLTIPQFALLYYISRPPPIVLRAFKPGPYPKDWRFSLCLPAQPSLADGRHKHLCWFSSGSCN